MKFLIFTRERTGSLAFWWKPNRHGYTSCVDRAGRFSEEEARAIVADSMGQELMIAEADLSKLQGGNNVISMIVDGTMKQIEQLGTDAWRSE